MSASKELRDLLENNVVLLHNALMSLAKEEIAAADSGAHSKQDEKALRRYAASYKTLAAEINRLDTITVNEKNNP